MNNKTAISHAADMARTANCMVIFCTRLGDPIGADGWRSRRAQHMATARQLKQDAQQ